MAKNQNTFEKRRREMEKKRKAAEKRDSRRKRKEQSDAEVVQDSRVEDPDSLEDRLAE